MADYPRWYQSNSRKIAERIVIECQLELQTPAHFGAGDDDGSMLPLSFDPRTGNPLLTGASIAGALRAYARNYQHGYGGREEKGSKAAIALLFGTVKGEDDGDQSRLIVHDSIGVVSPDANSVELRDGVKINPTTRTAEDQALYTFQTWSAGTIFPIRLELLIYESDEKSAELKAALATALHGLDMGEIHLGARKKRGFGQIQAKNWKLRTYNFAHKGDVKDWLFNGNCDLESESVEFSSIEAQLEKTIYSDTRQRFTIKAIFEIDGSILIRSGSEVADMAHLKLGGKSVVSGTSLAGAIRARAYKIVNTLVQQTNSPIAREIVDDMFGRHGNEKAKDNTRKPSPSRFIVKEAEITEGVKNLVQSRVSIDRFTGSALDTALFTQQPHWGGTVTLNIELRNPMDSEIGLLLLVLKDLWTGDLPIGGESSVGRGRLRGISGTLDYNGQQWMLNNQAGMTVDGDTHSLERFVQSLNKVEERSHA